VSPSENLPLWALIFLFEPLKICFDDKNEWYDMMRVHECMDE